MLDVPRRETRRSQRGVTILEIVVSASVLLVAAVGVTRSVVGSMAMTRTNRETSLATHAARRAVEQLRQEGFAEVFARYNDYPADDPDGPGTAPGAGFPVIGLQVRPGDPDGMVGRVLFPVATPDRLTEGVGAPFDGLPTDLNLDGDTTDGDVTATHLLLPAVVRVEWQGVGGERSVELRTLLAGDRP